jgi:PAS domain S-box-containing protein
MNNYRILLVEDDLNDAELNIREIKKIFPDAQFQRVDDRNSYIRMIETFNPDIILSDYNMPVFDGLTALRIANEMCPLTPFIVVTGSINEDTAVECMKAGATDYVLKDSLKRLGSAVIGAIKQRNLKKQRIEDEESLIRERKLLRTLIDNLPVTIYVKDAECRKIIANKGDLEVIGVESEKEIIGKTDLEIFGHEIGERGFQDDKQVIESGIPVLNREEDFYDAYGNQRWLLTSKIPITDEKGQPMGLVGIGRDITEQKLAQAKILKLSKGIEQSPSTILITDLNGTIEYVNPQFCLSTGYSEEEAIGQNPRILKSGTMDPQMYKNLWKNITSGGVWRGEMQNKRKDGTLYWEAATITGIKNEKGVITNYIAIKEDITERKKMQSELIASKEKAEESDRLKSAFLANMSHEIRTPLNSIIGFSELLTDPDFEEDQKKEFVQAIIVNGNSLLAIISDIMDFSMLESHQMKIRIETISTEKLMNDLYHDFKKQASAKGLDLRIDDTINNHIELESDLYRIKQIFNNLISNSIKFTETGYIEIGYRVVNEFVEFKVKDTGIGILPEYHQTIFERFRQLDTAKTRKYGGNGLGLAISKNLVELLGGKIWVESEINNYSEFYFTIPLKYKKEYVV